MAEYPCPACGFVVFTEPPGSYEICPVCGWEDDHVQLRYPALRGAANGQCLYEAQQGVLRRIPLAMRAYAGYRRASDWRPLEPEECSEPKTPLMKRGYFAAALEDSPEYYWRRRRPG